MGQGRRFAHDRSYYYLGCRWTGGGEGAGAGVGVGLWCSPVVVKNNVAAVEVATRLTDGMTSEGTVCRAEQSSRSRG